MPESLQDVVAEAIRDFEEHGYDDQDRLTYWEGRLRTALDTRLRSPAELTRMLKESLRQIFDRLVERGQVLRSHDGINRFTLQNLAPRLHAELDRRILASANLIRLNRVEMINKTLQRFSGWATSVPRGGSEQVDTRRMRAEIAEPLRKLPFVERRVLIDQGHKLNASISATVAVDGGAIAGRWFSHWRQAGYDYRGDHKERDNQVYLIRGSWAVEQGLVKPGPAGWSDAITQPAEEPFCRCKFTYLYHLRQLPLVMLTQKGHAALQRARSR